MHFDATVFDIFPGRKINKLIPSKQNRPFPSYLLLQVQSKLPLAGYFWIPNVIKPP